jgi:hypothetical protein
MTASTQAQLIPSIIAVIARRQHPMVVCSTHSAFRSGVSHSLYSEHILRQPIVTGTSVLAIKYKDGIMMAADNLGSLPFILHSIHSAHCVAHPPQLLMAPLHVSKAFSVYILSAIIQLSAQVVICPTFNTFSISSMVLLSPRKQTHKMAIHLVPRKFTNTCHR